MQLSISSGLYEKLLTLATDLQDHQGHWVDGNDVDLLAEIIIRRALDIDPLMDAVEVEYAIGPEEE